MQSKRRDLLQESDTIIRQMNKVHFIKYLVLIKKEKIKKEDRPELLYELANVNNTQAL